MIIYWVMCVEYLAASTHSTWRRKWQPTPVFLPGESHGRRSLVGHSPRGRKESDTTERLHFTHSTPVANSVMTMKNISRYGWMCLVCKNLLYPHSIENHSNNICIIRPEEWNSSCHSSKQMMSQSSAIAVTMEGERVSPEGTQNTCHQAAIRLQPLPTVSPEETQRCENTGYWPQTEETYTSK